MPRAVLASNVMPKTAKHEQRRKRADQAQPSVPWKLPNWLPQPVVGFASTYLAELHPQLGIELNRAQRLSLQQLRRRLKRLTTDARMEFVWQYIAREKTKISEAQGPFQVHHGLIPNSTDAFLRGFLNSAITADSRVEYWKHAPSAKQQRITMRRIRHHACKLLKFLGPRGDYYNWTPWDPLTGVLYSPRALNKPFPTLLRNLADQTKERHWSNGEPTRSKTRRDTVKSKHVPAYPNSARALLGDLPSQLTALAGLSTLCLDDDGGTTSKPPYKTKHLKQTVYVRELARILHSQGLHPRQSKGRQPGFPLHQIIAITLNVAFDLSRSDALKADTVRKLVLQDR